MLCLQSVLCHVKVKLSRNQSWVNPLFSASRDPIRKLILQKMAAGLIFLSWKEYLKNINLAAIFALGPLVFLSQLSFCAGNANQERRMTLRIKTRIGLSTNLKTVLYLSRPELVLIRRNLNKPRQETTIIDQWLPLGLIPEWLDRKLEGNFKEHGQKGVLEWKVEAESLSLPIHILGVTLGCTRLPKGWLIIQN